MEMIKKWNMKREASIINIVLTYIALVHISRTSTRIFENTPTQGFPILANTSFS